MITYQQLSVVTKFDRTLWEMIVSNLTMSEQHNR